MMSDACPYTRRRRILYRGLVAACFALGAAARFYGAWACRYLQNPDTGIVALMVKHMAEGKEWPVFFYGQAYMGTLEPMVSVLATFALGVTGFAVCAGTALMAVASLPVIYAWGRDAGGRAGGLAALALCAIGPYYYFMFQFVPRGGYTVTLLLGLLVMWLSTRTAVRMHTRGDPARGGFFLIGVLAGLGWWTNQLIAPALLAAAAILALGLRGRIWRAGPLLGLAGFLLGGLPFWVWNLLHDGASFDMLSSVGGVKPGEGLRLLWIRYERLIGLETWPSAVRRLVLWGGPAGALLGLLAALARFRRAPLRLPAASALTLLLFITASILVFIRSSFAAMNTARYLIPLVPAGAILFGLFIGRVHPRIGTAAAALPVVLLMATHWPAIPELCARSARVPQQREQDAELKRFLLRHEIDAVYSHFMDHALNFNLGEAVVVTDLRGDRYAPYARRAELAERIAVLRNYGKVAEFAAAAGGTMQTRDVGGHGVRYAFRPPEGGLIDITDAGVTSIVDRTGQDCRKALTDGDIDMDWIGRHEAGRTEWLELGFERPTPVRCLRLFTLGRHLYPRRARIDFKATATDAWRVLHPPHIVTDFFWSGPRPYWRGRRQRLEYRFDDVTVSALRVVSLEPRRADGLWQVSELRCFGPGPNPLSRRQHLPDLLRTIKEQSIGTLYCDRWEANHVFERFGTDVRVELLSSCFPEAGLHEGSVEWTRDAGLLVAAHDLAATQAVLTRENLHWTEHPVGPWVLLQPESNGPGGAGLHGVRPNLYWTGTQLLSGKDLRPNRQTPVVFPRGIVLRGVSLAPARVAAGQALEITWFWELAVPDAALEPLAFVHFVAGEERFQDDHPFFGAAATWRATQGGRATMIRDRRRVCIPADAAPGPRDIHIGLYLPAYGKRLRPKTDLPTHRRAVILTNAFSVVSPAP